MKQMTITRILKCTALLLPIVAVLLLTQSVLFRYADTNTDRIHDFYTEPEHSLDVVFLGASEVFADFSPAYAYDNYGFTSYPYAQDANPATLYLSQLKEITAQQSPEVIFVEINGFLYSDVEQLREESRLRIYTENIPWSENKIRTIMEYDYEDKLSCIFPFIKYHGNWQNPTVLKYRIEMNLLSVKEPAMLKGIYSRTFSDTAPVLEMDKASDERTEPIIELAEHHLRQFLDYCRTENLNVVFVRFPHKIVDDGTLYSFRQANRAGEIVEEYGFEFLNLDKQSDEIGIDHMTDFYNSDHLNIYGQRKMTDYLSRRILDVYGVTPMPQTAENEMQWKESVRTTNTFYDYTEEAFRNGEDLWLSETPTLLKTLNAR